MLKQPQLDDNASWKQRFRAPVITWTRLARANPTRGLAASNRSGVVQLYAWDVPTGALTQLTNRPAGTVFGTIAPDGRNTLWVRSLDSRSAQQINDTDDATHPFWAPDSRRIGFFAAGKLKIVDTANGAIQNLSDAPSGRGGASTKWA